MIKLYLHIGAVCLTGLSFIPGSILHQNARLSEFSNQMQENLVGWLQSDFNSRIQAYFTPQLIAQAQTTPEISTSQTTPLPELEAWNGTKWGMNVEQVKQLFEHDIFEKNYRRCSGTIRHLCSSYGLNDYRIGNHSYDVEFTFVANQLTEIKFTSFEQNLDYSKIKFDLDNIQTWLTNQHGLPAQVQKQTTDYGSIVEQKWHLPAKNIQLYYETTHNLDISHLAINFTPNFERFQIQTGLLN